MSLLNHQLELLAPARDADIGIQAINHGADAVYIGGPGFGARASAGNSIQDIERLCRHAHRFGSRIFITLNTILRDDELEPARRMAWDVYNAGADVLIVQDMGLLEIDLPPIQLHASTQTDIRTPEKARFLQDAGFSQIVLARELTLEQIRDVHAVLDPERCKLEFFVHGALCVAYSGQCFISHAHTGRSANRGNCSQECRLPYTVTDNTGLTATCVGVVTVVDNIHPVISNCPSNITVNAGAACSATATWTVPTAEDNCAGYALVRTAGPAPGSTFPLGTTNVIYTATDASGTVVRSRAVTLGAFEPTGEPATVIASPVVQQAYLGMAADGEPA